MQMDSSQRASGVKSACNQHVLITQSACQEGEGGEAVRGAAGGVRRGALCSVERRVRMCAEKGGAEIATSQRRDCSPAG